MKKLLFILCFLISYNSFATCIVIMLKNNTLYVASDSRSTVFFKNKSGINDSLFKSICKIHKSGSIYFTMAGHGDQIIPPILEKDLSSKDNLLNNWKLAISEVKQKYEQYFEQMRIHDYKSFLGYKQRGDICEISIFGFQNNQAFLTTAYFNISSNEINTVKINVTENNKSSVILGFHDHLDKPTNDMPFNKKALKDLIYFAEDLVKYEMSFHKGYIGGPIDLLKLTAKQAIWVRKKPICN